MKKILIIISILFLFNINAKAASLCSYTEQSELNSKVANIKVSSEAVEDITGDDYIFVDNYFKISITNVTDDFYIVVSNNLNQEEEIFYSSDAVDGIITFKWSEISNVANLTFQVYTTDNTNCSQERYKTIYLTIPRYNEHSKKVICSEYPDFYLCQKYVTFEEVSDVKFLEKLDSYKEGNIDNKGEEAPEKENLGDKIFDFIDDYKWYIVGSVAIIIIGCYTIHRIKTKKQRELGL